MNQRVKEVIVLTAAYYRQDLSDEVVMMYASDLADLDQDAVVAAYERFRRDPRNIRMPLPAHIRGLIERGSSDEAIALEAAARIISAVKKFGYSNREGAHLYIGGLGWRVVELQGGWQPLCEMMNEKMVPTLQAQFRELAKAQLDRARAGELDTPPTLPPTSNPAMQLIASLASEKALKP